KNFLFEFRSTENVLGTRHVVIKPREDFAPVVDVAPEVIRKTKEGYMVTAQARIPFAGSVKDDNGLGEVRYAYTVERIEAGRGKASPQSLCLPGSTPMLAADGSTHLLAAAYVLSLARSPAREESEAKPAEVRRTVLPRYLANLNDRRGEYLPMNQVQEML